MNIIHQEREEIIRNNNTAQTHLGDILDTIKRFGDYGPSFHDLTINEPLEGTVDFSVLEEHGFHYINKINFQAKGRIVEIRNFPKKLSHLYCSNQLLVELQGLPTGLEVLECDNNFLEHLDLTDTPKLKILKCSNNHLQTLENIPATMEELICENNEIKRLDLRTTTEKLKVLHCSNNKTIVLEGSIDTILDFKSENNPFFDAMKLCKTEGETGMDADAEANDQKNKIEFEEALNNYFKLKNTYETNLREKKRRAFEEERKNGKNPKKGVKNVLPKCINCKSKMGTIFELNERKYTAVCGDTREPCNLKIEIYSGNYDFDVHTVVLLANQKLESIKHDILKLKMETVLDYIKPDETVELNKKLLNEFTEHSKIHEEIMKKYEETMHGEIRTKCIQDKQLLVYRLIFQVNLLLKEYEKLQDPEILKMAVQLQVNELHPEIHNLQLLKYDVMEMNIMENQQKITSHLHQRVLSPEKHENAFNEASPRVVHFILRNG